MSKLPGDPALFADIRELIAAARQGVMQELLPGRTGPR